METSRAQAELLKATLPRKAGNEGKARVLARRAAGMAIRASLEKSDSPMANYALNDLIKKKEVRSYLPLSLIDCLERLTTKVDHEYRLPANFDLIADAEQVIKTLSNNMEEAK